MQVGDRVFIRKFDESNRPWWAIQSMDEWSGREYTINELYENNRPDGEVFWYVVEDDREYFWAESWMELVDDGGELDMASEPDIMEFLGVV